MAPEEAVCVLFVVRRAGGRRLVFSVQKNYRSRFFSGQAEQNASTHLLWQMRNDTQWGTYPV